jgi:hypothetical protein
MGPRITAAVALGVVFVVLVIVVAQPSRAWRAAAEHSRLFWLAWIVLSLAVGAAPAAATELDWATAAWLAVCCALGTLQPAMIADLLDIRRHIAFGRRAPRSGPPPIVVDADGMAPIHWRAP